MDAWRYSIDRTNRGEIMRMVSGLTIAEDRLVRFQAILDKVGDRFTVGSLAATRKYGKPYQCGKRERASITRQVEIVINGGLESEVQALWVTGQSNGRHLEFKRGDFMENTSETKTAKAPKATYGQCSVVPRATSKAGETRCPRMITAANEYNVCLGHLAFIKRGSETKLLDGRILNPRPAAEPKPTPSTEPAAVTMADIQVPPEVTPKVKKLSKRAKVQAALAVIHQKDVQKAAEQAAN